MKNRETPEFSKGNSIAQAIELRRNSLIADSRNTKRSRVSKPSYEHTVEGDFAIFGFQPGELSTSLSVLPILKDKYRVTREAIIASSFADEDALRKLNRAYLNLLDPLNRI